MFWERLNQLCAEHNVKLTNVVKELGMSTGNQSKWKNGVVPKSDILKKFAGYFNVSVDYLLGNTIYRTVDEAATAFEITADRAVENLVEWLEDHEFEVGSNDNDNGAGVEWYISKNGKIRHYEENMFKAECVSLSETIVNAGDFIYEQWTASQLEEVETSIDLNEDEAELIWIFRKLNRPAIHELMAKAYELRDRVEKEKTGSTEEPAVG